MNTHPGSMSTDAQVLNTLMPIAMAAAVSNGTGIGTSNGSGPVPSQPSQPSNGISADEIALYDRQIRLWGMQAQEKIRNANILLITMRALANEVAKNLVLAGIGSLTIVDHEAVTEADLGSQFLLSAQQGHVGTNRAAAASHEIRKLNPRVAVHVDAADIRTKGAGYFAPFDIVIATDLDSDTLNIINTATRLNNHAFYAAGCHGLYGFVFADLIEHDFVIERNVPNVPTTVKQETRTRSVVAVQTKKDDPAVEQVTKRELYSTWYLSSDGSKLPPEFNTPRRRRAVTPALSCLRALWEFTSRRGRNPNINSREDLTEFTILVNEKHRALGLPTETLTSEFLRSFMQNIGSEIAPVAAVLGGLLAQDVINVLGQREQPIQNFTIFDGETFDAPKFALHPDGELGGRLLAAGPQVMGNGVAAGTSNGLGLGVGVGVPMVDPSQVISLD